MAFRFQGDNIQTFCHSLFEPLRPMFTASLTVKIYRVLHLRSRFRVEFDWFAWAWHLHCFEGLQRIGALNFAGINLVYPPPDVAFGKPDQGCGLLRVHGWTRSDAHGVPACPPRADAESLLQAFWRWLSYFIAGFLFHGIAFPCHYTSLFEFAFQNFTGGGGLLFHPPFSILHPAACGLTGRGGGLGFGLHVEKSARLHPAQRGAAK